MRKVNAPNINIKSNYTINNNIKGGYITDSSINTISNKNIMDSIEDYKYKPIEKVIPGNKNSIFFNKSDNSNLTRINNNNINKFTSTISCNCKDRPQNNLNNSYISSISNSSFTNDDNFKRIKICDIKNSTTSAWAQDISKSDISSNISSTVGRKKNYNSTAWKNSNYKEQEYAVSIIENYAREVGVTAFNFRTMELFITQFIDNEAYVNSITVINFWRPLELIINQKSENTCLHLLIKKYFKNAYIGLMPRKFFAEDIGKEIYLKSGKKELSIEELNTKYVCMASLSGLISYLEHNSSLNIEKEFLNIKFHYLQNHLNISFQSTIELELLLNNKFKKSFGSLFSLFNCRTVSGMRLLRSNILQPLAVREEIVKRYQSVEELLNNPEIIIQIREYLEYFKDLELSIAKFMHKVEEPSENIMKQILTSIQNIRASLKTLKNFKEIIKYKLKSELFLLISNCFEDKIYEFLLEKIESLIEEFDFTNTKITRKQDSIFFMIKAGVNNVLDVSRKTYSDTINEIYAEYEKLRISSNDPNIKLQYSEAKGYYIVLTEKYFNEADYVVSKKVGRKYNCMNIALISLSERIKEIKRDLIDISMNLILEVIQLIRKNINYLYVLSSYIALVDLLCSFAEYSKFNRKVCKPIISFNLSHPYIFTKNCRHPLYEKNPILSDAQHESLFVPNEYFFTNQFNMIILKGPNASGKTTYMKQLAILIILAQIGCFVPCDYFEFSMRKFLYTKFDSNDNVEENRSTFIKEITEIQKVVCNQLQDSLILLDEPFDNSDSIENLSLAFAILDQFSPQSYSNTCKNSFVIISSHNHSLSQLADYFFNIIIGTMVVEFTDESMSFLYKFKFNNPANKIHSVNNNFSIDESSLNNYGIILANMIGYDKEIIENSKEFASISQHENHHFIERSEHIEILKLFIFKLLHDLYELRFISNCYVIEDEVAIKKREIQQFLNYSIN